MSKRYYYWQNKLNEIKNSLDNPTRFWKTWKNSKETHIEQKPPEISGQDWYKHFQNLHTESNDKQLPKDTNTETVHTTSYTQIKNHQN